MTRPKTNALYEELKCHLPGGVNSPIRACRSMQQLPMVVSSGSGDMITDVDGRHYIDYCGSWGALLHGHAHPEILEAVARRMKRGTSFGIATEVELDLALAVKRLIPSIEKIRFVSSGTEATMSAVRLARGYTKRELVIKFSGHYHGHADFFLVKAGSGVIDLCPDASSAGIPKDFVKHTINLTFNDIEACQKVFDQYGDKIAAVILEPVAGNIGVVPAEPAFIDFLRKETEKVGALLIFDEVITGFRVAKGGAQSLYNVKPDLTCLGKILGGGFPAAAFGGRKEVMDQLAPDGPVYQAGTLSGNPVAMEAGLQSLRLLDRPGFYEELERKTALIVNPLNETIRKHKLNLAVQQVGSMFTLFFGVQKVNSFEEALKANTKEFAAFFRDLFEKGVYMPPLQHEPWFVSAAHSDENLKKTAFYIIDYLESREKQ